ncbi:MAG: T9SS type A sorting domain-containing protein [Cryomorphaceae bacterium]|nr:T9SS type A sorting domain-containing protein [Flavobacteriales bacterium]
MKRYALALIASVATLTTLAQNLVPNPSFEEYLECPQSTGELHQQVTSWYSWQLTPDFFQYCNNDGLGTAGIPDNAWGTQWPITGDAYSGVITFEDFNPEGREYMAAQLSTALNSGEQYYMMFHASMYDGGSKDLRWCATNNIGMRFFKDPDYTAFPPDANPLQPDNFAHLNYSEILDDYTNWTLIEGWFTADDDYNWVAIGNFFTDDQTDIVILNDEGACSGIYYIENVCVASSPEECDYLLSSDANRPLTSANIYPNPATESVRFSLPESELHNVDVFDMQGRLVKNIQDMSSGYELNVSTFQKGVYVVRVSNNQYFTTIKLIIQ